MKLCEMKGVLLARDDGGARKGEDGEDGGKGGGEGRWRSGECGSAALSPPTRLSPDAPNWRKSGRIRLLSGDARGCRRAD